MLLTYYVRVFEAKFSLYRVETVIEYQGSYASDLLVCHAAILLADVYMLSDPYSTPCIGQVACRH